MASTPSARSGSGSTRRPGPRFEAHRRQVTEARTKAESETGDEGGDTGTTTTGGTHTSGTPDRGDSGGGALASDEALAALRDKLSGGQS